MQSGLPCQDLCLTDWLAPDGWGIVVLCDGAGSASQSELGAQVAANFCKTLLSESAERNGWLSSGALPTLNDWAQESARIFAAVRDHMAEEAARQACSIADLGCTLMFALFSRQGILFGHVGDGRAAYKKSDGEWTALMNPYRGDEAGSTVFVTSSVPFDNKECFVEHRVVDGPIAALCLMSDGCEKAAFQCNIFDEVSQTYSDPNIPHAKFLDPNVEALRSMTATGVSEKDICSRWGAFLLNGNDVLAREPDDKTMFLAAWMDGSGPIDDEKQPPVNTPAVEMQQVDEASSG